MRPASPRIHNAILLLARKEPVASVKDPSEINFDFAKIRAQPAGGARRPREQQKAIDEAKNRTAATPKENARRRHLMAKPRQAVAPEKAGDAAAGPAAKM